MTRSIRRPAWQRAHEHADYYGYVVGVMDQDTSHLVWQTVQVPNEPLRWLTWQWRVERSILRELGA